MLLLIGLFMMYSIIYHYSMAAFSSPGRPEHEPEGDWMRQCKKCSLAKPPRTHHCSVCKKCTLKMDHHCPWLNNCIGLMNYRYFVCFLIWVSSTTMYIVLLAYPKVMEEGSLLFPYVTVDDHPAAHTGSNNLKLFGIDYTKIFERNGGQLRGSVEGPRVLYIDDNNSLINIQDRKHHEDFYQGLTYISDVYQTFSDLIVGASSILALDDFPFFQFHNVFPTRETKLQEGCMLIIYFQVGLVAYYPVKRLHCWLYF